MKGELKFSFNKLVLAIPSIFALILFLPALKFKFIWDDVIVMAGSIHSLKGYSAFLGCGLLSYYRPLVALSFMLDYSIWFHNPFGFHLTNLLLYVFVVFLATMLLYRLFNSVFLAVVGGVLFACLPCHVESVAWVAGRTDLLAAVFLFLSCLACMEYFETQASVALWLCAFFALFSMWGKEVGVAYIFIVLSLAFVVGYRLKFKEFLIVSLPLVMYILLKLSCLWKSLFFSSKVQGLSLKAYYIFWVPLTLLGVLKGLMASLGFYIWRVIWPFDLRPLWARPPKHWIFYFLSISLILLLVVSLRWRLRELLFASVWFIVTVAPALILAIVVKTPAPVADRYVFIPSFSFSILVVFLLSRLKGRFPVLLILLIASALCVSDVYAVERYLPIWQNNNAFWREVYRKAPYSPLATYWYARQLFRERKIDEAEAVVRKIFSMTRLNTRTAEAYRLLANIYLYRGEFSKALDYAGLSIKAHPTDFGYFTRASIYVKLYMRSKDPKILNNIIRDLQMAVKLLPSRPLYHYHLALAYLQKGYVSKAEKELAYVIDLEPRGKYAGMAKRILFDIKSGRWGKS